MTSTDQSHASHGNTAHFVCSFKLFTVPANISAGWLKIMHQPLVYYTVLIYKQPVYCTCKASAIDCHVAHALDMIFH